jgi:hypothetical protein
MIKLILKSLILLSFRLNLHFIYSYILYYKTKVHHDKKLNGIIVFNRVNSDMEHLTKVDKYNYFILNSKLQYGIASLFLDKEIMSQKEYFLTKNSKHISQKENFKNEIYKVLKHFKKLANIKYIFVANCNYFEHQEWANAGNVLKIKLIVYSKESVLPKGRSDAFNSHFTSLSESIKNIDKIFVYGESGYEQYKNSKLVKNQNIHKVGALKTDYLFNKIKNIQSQDRKKDITFFAFPCGEFPINFDPDSFNSQVWQGGYWAPKLWKDSFDLFLEVAESFPNEKFVIKTKSEESTSLIMDQAIIRNLSNVVYTHDKPTWKIYKDSQLIFGFNSTVLLEMLITDIPVFIPKWHEAESQKLGNKMILNSPSNAYNTFHSKDEMKDRLSNFIVDKKNLEIKNYNSAREMIIKNHFHKVDGKVANRILLILE